MVYRVNEMTRFIHAGDLTAAKLLLVETLVRHRGNVTHTALSLGASVASVKRWIVRFSLRPFVEKTRADAKTSGSGRVAGE